MKFIHSEQAPAAVGPYSQAVYVGNLMFVSGQIALVPETMELEPDNIFDQTHRVITNIENILLKSNMTLENIVKTTIFLSDMSDFSDVNSVYEARFGDHRPARSTIEVNRIPLDALVKIECIAYI